MERVTIELCDSTVESLDFVADAEYGGDRHEAVRALLSDWINQPR